MFNSQRPFIHSMVQKFLHFPQFPGQYRDLIGQFFLHAFNRVALFQLHLLNHVHLLQSQLLNDILLLSFQLLHQTLPNEIPFAFQLLETVHFYEIPRVLAVLWRPAERGRVLERQTGKILRVRLGHLFAKDMVAAIDQTTQPIATLAHVLLRLRFERTSLADDIRCGIVTRRWLSGGIVRTSELRRLIAFELHETNHRLVSFLDRLIPFLFQLVDHALPSTFPLHHRRRIGSGRKTIVTLSGVQVVLQHRARLEELFARLLRVRLRIFGDGKRRYPGLFGANGFYNLSSFCWFGF